MARTSSLNCLSCRNPYQTSLIHWIASPLFTENPFYSLKSASSHPLPKNQLWCERFCKSVKKLGGAPSTVKHFRSKIGTTKKLLTRVSKQVPGVHGKRGLERGWQKRLAEGWRKVGEGFCFVAAIANLLPVPHSLPLLFLVREGPLALG